MQWALWRCKGGQGSRHAVIAVVQLPGQHTQALTEFIIIQSITCHSYAGLDDDAADMDGH